MAKKRKVVAAGWYVGGGLAFLLFGIPAEWLTPPLRVVFCLLGVICFGGAAYEWWFRKGDEQEGVGAVSKPGTVAEVTPRLVACGESSAMIDPTEVSVSPGTPGDALLAAMAAVEYDPALASGPRVIVRAEIWFEQRGHEYRGGGTTAHVANGYWRDAPRNQAPFGPGVRHELVIAVDHRGLVKAIQDERSERSDLRPTITHLGSYANTSGHEVKISLIQLDENTHQRLAVNTLRYVLHIGQHELYLVKIDDD